jgi:Spy/CpxP family protein refolding chaperone
MRNLLKLAGALVVMTTFSAFAQEKAKAPGMTSQQMANAKAAMMKDHQSMMVTCDKMDKQVTALQASATPEQAKQIAALQQSLQDLKKQLAATPHYFDAPQGGGIQGQ